MRPFRLVLVLTSFVAFPLLLTTFSVVCAQPGRRVENLTSTKQAQKSGLRAFFSFTAPGSLFPPQAVISLTDENSTFFLARPAAFGPDLPLNGLSGQLWVGSGFGDEGTGRGGAFTGAEGELGCSDVPSWADGKKPSAGDRSHERATKEKAAVRVDAKASKSDTVKGHERRNDDENVQPQGKSEDKALAPSEEDGTDDHLHYPLPGSQEVKPNKPGQPAEHDGGKDGHASTHADIQSLQESAEIAGKVVLLSRGGCGFLEKVKWVQRRGGVALIVGDNTRGTPLITMYAKEGTSNVTIPSLFTTYTTAHLLSALIPRFDDGGSEDGSKSGSGDDGSRKTASKKKGSKNAKELSRGPGATNVNVLTRPTGGSRSSVVVPSSKYLSSSVGDTSKEPRSKTSWLRALGSALKLTDSTSSPPADSRRPPTSGRINWIVSEDWADEPLGTQKKSNTKIIKSSDEGKTSGKSSLQGSSGDDFVIGVQDWRDPDLVGHQSVKSLAGQGKNNDETKVIKTSTISTASMGKQTGGVNQKGAKGFSGGSITPGSGEYETPSSGNGASNRAALRGKPQSFQQQETSAKAEDDNPGWLGRLWSSDSEGSTAESSKAHDVYLKNIATHFVEDLEFQDEEQVEGFLDHEGLWVTMTMTATNSNPFFDTLLVLVVSPLVTLTVVYALLLLRSRIRRRRWRAPKSVVDRLPVRTYHTMADSPTATSSQVASPLSSNPASPLLQMSPKSYRERPRPRSRTTSGIAENVSTSLIKATNKALLTQGEKAPTKKRYNGKQVECVVCLEEYVDGVSRVMRLPCGHEFHAECITPWLTTRRRTCPICKGDVVRSLASSSTPPTPSPTRTSHPHPHYHDPTSAPADPDSIQAQAAETANESPSSAIPIPRGAGAGAGAGADDADLDLERGGPGAPHDDDDDDLAATLVNDPPDGAFSPRPTGWRSLASLSLSAFSGEAAWRQAQADRNR
ncbi:hypothetical protein MMC34_002593 [Xylographa carneopallida]|nr:hypothetical protein [Xylographa carneopallida]